MFIYVYIYVCVCIYIYPWRRKWQPTPVFLPWKFHGQRGLLGYCPWGCKELATTEWLSIYLYIYPSLLYLPPTIPPSHTSKSSQCTELPLLYISFLLASYFTHGRVYVYVKPKLSIHPPPSPHIHMSILYICISCPAMEPASSALMVRMSVCILSLFSLAWLFATWWTVARQAPLSMGFSRQESMAIIIKIYKW